MTGDVCARIAKIDDEKRLVFGWAYVAKRANGEQVTDISGDEVHDLEGFEDAVYDYVLFSREGDEMHTQKVVARMVESVVFTPAKASAMGLDSTPTGWWIGMKVEDGPVWQKVKNGDLEMFSIAGTGTRE